MWSSVWYYGSLLRVVISCDANLGCPSEVSASETDAFTKFDAVQIAVGISRSKAIFYYITQFNKLNQISLMSICPASGRAISHAFARQFLTVESRVESRVILRETSDERNGTGADFSL